MTTKESCLKLSNRCDLLNIYENLRIDIDRNRRLMRKSKKMLDMGIQHEPTKRGFEELIIKTQEKIVKNKELMLQLKKNIKCI